MKIDGKCQCGAISIEGEVDPDKATVPPAPATNTQTVLLKAKITDFQGVTGCTATVIGSLGLRID